MRPSSGVRRLDSKHNAGSNSQNSKSTTDNTNEGRQGSQLELQDSDEDEMP